MPRNRPHLTGTINLSGRDEQANGEVAEILAELPADHPARLAFAMGKDTIALTHLLADRKDLNARLMDTYWARHDRVFSSSQNTSGRIMESLPSRRNGN
jgi:hypothetical protein